MASGASCHSSQAFSVDQRRGFIPAFAALLLVGLIAGCGGGGKDHPKATTTKTATSPRTETATERTETATTTTPAGHTETSTSPENRQGGAGDEEPARSQALFTGKGGRVTP